jgi:SAM-dependent methyltransferase
MTCRFCGTPLSHLFIDLGAAPFSNAFLEESALDRQEIYYPLKAFVCHACFLVQVGQYARSDQIFSDDYVYLSSMSKSWLEHSRQYVGMIVPRLGLGGRSSVVEIASNDGYLLQYFMQQKIPCLGIEPTRGTAELARKKGIPVVERFFGKELADEMTARGERADLIIGNNVLAHVPDINDFVEGLRVALKPEGTVTMEFPHLLRLVANTQFDTIYHEHFSYLSLGTVQRIFNAHGLELYDVEQLSTHGGSLRIYARHAGSAAPSQPRVKDLLEQESLAGMNTLEYYAGFKNSALRIKLDFMQFLIDSARAGKTIAGYGAAAKGNTLLNYCGQKSDIIRYVADAAPSKQGKFLPGSHIPVVPEEQLRRRKPDYIIIFPWNIKDEVMQQLDYARQWGGKFVMAVPTLTVTG